MSNLLAAVGRGQLEHLDDHVQRRRQIFARYQLHLGNLPGVNFMPEPAGCRSTRWLTVLTIDSEEFGASREEIRLALEKQNIESRPLWKPMHLQPAFSSCPVRGGEVADELFHHGLCLPSGSNLSSGDLRRIVDVIRKTYRTARAAVSILERIQ